MDKVAVFCEKEEPEIVDMIAIPDATPDRFYFTGGHQ